MSNTSNASTNKLSEIPVVSCNGLPKNDAEVLACARALWKSRVDGGIEPVICLSEGFYQHEAECVSDSVQMVLCSCDHFKEVVQPLLINGTVRMLENVKPDDDIDRLITAAMPQEFLYLQGLQLRFARHYLNEYMRSKNNRATVGPFRSKGASGLQCAASFKYFTDDSKTAKIYKEKGLAGMAPNEIIKRYSDVLFLLKFYTSVEIPNKKLDLKILDANTILSIYNTNNAIAMFSIASNLSTPGEMAHFTVYYTCGGHEYYYDNHSGIFPFMWSTFFKWMRNTSNTLLGPDMNIRIHRVDINFLLGFGKTSQKCKYYPLLEVYNDKIPFNIGGTCYTLFPFTKDIIALKKNNLGAYVFDDKVSGRYVKVVSSIDRFFTEISILPIIINKPTTIKNIPRILFSRNSNTVYLNPVEVGSSSNQAASSSNAAGVAVPPGILPDYESDDDGVLPGHTNQPISSSNAAAVATSPDHMNQEVHTNETTAPENNRNIYNNDPGMRQGTQKRPRTQGGGRRLTRHKHHRAKRHTRHRHRSVHRKTKRVTRH